MGIFDKVKATVKNADSKAGELYDETKFKSEIAKEKSSIDKKYTEIGKLYYKRYSEGAENFTSELNELCETINASKKKIEELNQKIDQTKEDGKKERQDNWEAASETKEKNE